MDKILGVFQSWPPGQSIETDRRCSNREFCTFLDDDALSADSDHGSCVAEDMFMCVGCNEEFPEGAFESVDIDRLNKSRVAQGGSAY